MFKSEIVLKVLKKVQEADNSKRNSEESDVVLKIQQMVCLAAGYNAFSRKLKLSAVVKRSARDKAMTYRKNIQSQATVQPAGTSSKRNHQTATVEFTSRKNTKCISAAVVLKNISFAINLLRSRCQTFSRAYSSLKAFKAQALEESSFI
ncbi:hypothetical protein F511_17730 [Dorcoceras hygrometricum]|uniref:Uncharacterized protein n=1 Tax=Dorcoceras hygrometricum TaxID=472368 RepID=A0A2Z7AYI3_9LAMI|nr:hypothetical protein F511_17730 [Dorcoceras hygrometricum]